MYNKSDNSKVLPPIWGIIAGIFVVALGLLFIALTVKAVVDGEIFSLSRHNNSNLIVRGAEGFWFWVLFYGGCGLNAMLAGYRCIKPFRVRNRDVEKKDVNEKEV